MLLHASYVGGQMPLAPLSALLKGCWEIRSVRAQNLCFWPPGVSPPAGAEARFLFATLAEA